MDSQKFVEGYRKSPDRFRFYDDTPETQELMKGPRKWASFFDQQLSAHLKGEATDSPVEINTQLNNYEFGWSEPFLDSLILETQNHAFYDKKASSIVNELNFHILNKEFLPMWRRVLLPSLYPQLTRDEIEAMQTGLATRGAELKLVKDEALKWQKIEKSPMGLVAALNGQMTEIDASIVMLEIPKDSPHLALLPAPPQFESTLRNTRSADFIMLDTELWHSRGIQVKTYIDSFKDLTKAAIQKTTRRPTRKYDDKFVTLVDGTIDLGNFNVVSTPGKEAILVSDPGQISVNYLNDSHNTDIAQAKRNIEGRIIHDLYKN